MSNSYPHLFEPVRLAKTLFRNRLFSSPQDTYRLDSRNFLNDDATAFYEVKALGGFASVCVGDFMVDARAGHSHPFQLNGDDPMGQVSLTKTFNAIYRHGAVAAVELNHAGNNAGMMAEREGFIYGVSPGERNGVPIREMDEEWIERLINCYANAASFARRCGAGMITLHAGHGWLPAQFMSPGFNKRTDKWGGSLESRMRFPLAVIKAIRNRVGANIPIEIRISGEEIVPDGYELDEGIRIAKALDGFVDLIHVSAGHHENDAAAMVTHPTMFLPDGVNVRYAAEIKKHVKTPVATVGALTNPAHMEEILASGQADIIQLGRQTLADPDLPLKAKRGCADDINECLRCFTCFSESTASGIFYCAINPVIGRERDALYGTPPRKKQRVLVAGGGVGGMQAALTANEMGHEVILCEKMDRLGGVLLCEEKVPFKAKLALYLERQARRLERSDVTVRMNTAVTPELAKSLNPDVIICALGARPIVPPIPGIENSPLAEDVYKDEITAGKTVAIMGGGLVGIELGIYLAHLGRDVTVVEMTPNTIIADDKSTSERIGEPLEIEHGTNIVHGVAIAQELKKLTNMRVLTSTKALQIKDGALLAEGKNGEFEIPADTVINALGQVPLMDEALALRECAVEFYQIGDCITPRNIQSATQAAYQIARDIGR